MELTQFAYLCAYHKWDIINEFSLLAIHRQIRDFEND